MHRPLFLLLLLVVVVLPGCYHATVVTGEPAGTTVVDRPWALGFIYGLIPPPTVETMAECPNGVAVVETQHSFLNQLVSFLTAGLVTPMHITVTCAAGGSGALAPALEAYTVAEGAATPDVVSTFQTAADQAVASGEPVLVRFE